VQYLVLEAAWKRQAAINRGRRQPPKAAMAMPRHKAQQTEAGGCSPRSTDKEEVPGSSPGSPTLICRLFRLAPDSRSRGGAFQGRPRREMPAHPVDPAARGR
jgi:hypothetical protein